MEVESAYPGTMLTLKLRLQSLYLHLVHYYSQRSCFIHLHFGMTNICFFNFNLTALTLQRVITRYCYFSNSHA
jgi:hypothetical protein